MAHGRRVLAENGASANRQRASRSGKGKAAALPLKFFNVRTSERFVFKRRDKRCLTLSPRSSLIPVFIHFSDFFPDLVQATLANCKALILGCERVVILKPNQGKPMSDDVVWEGPGASLPDRCWDRQGVLLRTLDIVAYKVFARDRKRELLPIEQQLWDVMRPFLGRIKDFAKSLNVGALELEHHMESPEVLFDALCAQAPWSVKVSAVVSDASPAAGDREHILYYSPKNGVFTREFIDHPDDEDRDAGIPLVTLPCRLQSVLPTHPSVAQVLRYLVSIAARIESAKLRAMVEVLADKHPVLDESVRPRQQQEQDHLTPTTPSQQPPLPATPPTTAALNPVVPWGQEDTDLAQVTGAPLCGDKRVALAARNCASAKSKKRLKSAPAASSAAAATMPWSRVADDTLIKTAKTCPPLDHSCTGVLSAEASLSRAESALSRAESALSRPESTPGLTAGA